MNKETFFTIAAMLILTAWGLVADDKNILYEDFSTGKLDAYIKNGEKLNSKKVALQKSPGNADNQCLSLKKMGKVNFKMIPVQENTKYSLAFRGKFEGDETIEENPRLELLLIIRRGGSAWNPPGGGAWSLPTRKIVFYDADKKIISVIYKRMLFGKWHKYRDVFYSPRKAAFMQLSFMSGNNDGVFYMDDVKFALAPDEGAININPTFSYGKYNYSGWRRKFNGAGLLELENGEVVFDTAYGSVSKTFPLSKPGTYSLFIKKKLCYGWYNAVILRFLNSENRSIDRIHIRGRNSKPKDLQKYYILPKGARRGQFLVYNTILDEIRFFRVGGEEKLNELLEAKKSKKK